MLFYTVSRGYQVLRGWVREVGDDRQSMVPWNGTAW